MLTDDQHCAMGKMKLWFDHADHGDVFYLGGYAGTGKTTLATVFAESFAEYPRYCAFTAQAASVLKSKLGGSIHESSTIHSFIYKPIVGKNGEIEGWGKRGSLPSICDLIVVDEASMVTTKMLDDLLTYGVPVLLVGDPGQLVPIDGNGPNFDKIQHQHVLTEIHRQAADSDILKYATQVRTTGKWRAWNGTDLHTVKAAEYEKTLEKFVDKYSIHDVVTLSYSNRTRGALNDSARKLHRDLYAAANNAVDDPDFFATVPLICLENYEFGLYNGMRGNIVKTAIDDFWVTGDFDFEDTSDILRVSASAFGPQFGHPRSFRKFDDAKAIMGNLPQEEWFKYLGILIDYGYALTVHKSQGSSFPCVIVHLEKGGMEDEEFRRWAYTAATRCEKELVIVAG